MFIPRDPPAVDEWEYFKFTHHITFHLAPQKGLENIYEPIMIVRMSLGNLYVSIRRLTTCNTAAHGEVLP